MDLEIKGFIETSFLDWDGKVVSTLFVPHCNFRCPFCHNAGLIENPQDYETIPVPRIEKYLLEHRDFIDGICLTGGEPALHKNKGLIEFMRKINGLGFKMKFDTNGIDPELLQQILDEKLVDYIAMDIKGPLDERYDRLSGVKTDLSKIRQSIRIIRESGIPYEFRTTVIPGFLDAQDIEDIAREIEGAKRFVLQQFVAENCRDESLRGLKPFSREKFEELARVSRRFVPETLIRGA